LGVYVRRSANKIMAIPNLGSGPWQHFFNRKSILNLKSNKYPNTSALYQQTHELFQQTEADFTIIYILPLMKH